MADWDNYDAFEAFPKTPEFQDFLALLPKIAAGAPTIKNARFRTEAGIRDIATAPVIEITTTFVPLDVDEAAYERIIDTFVPLFAQNTPGFLGSASGWVIEEQENPKDATGPKVKAFVVCFAWENIGAHLAAKQIPANSEAIQPWKKAILSAEMVSLYQLARKILRLKLSSITSNYVDSIRMRTF